MMRRLLAITALISLAACGGGSSTRTAGGMLPVADGPPSPAYVPPGKYIKHIVILVQENRSFDDLFATFPGADGATRGRLKTGQYIALKKVPLYSPKFPSYIHGNFVTDYDLGKMDGFAEGTGNGSYLYQYVDPLQIAPYWTLAKKYVLADHLFMTQGSASYTAHQDLIRGGTRLDANRTIVDTPSAFPWGCDAPSGTTVPYLTNGGLVGPSPNPAPCYGKTYATLRDTLDAKNVSWKYYVPGKIKAGSPFDTQIWSAFDSVKAVRYGPEWGTKVVWPSSEDGTSRIFKDIRSGELPAVSWVIPDACNSDHPGNFTSECGAHDTGPSWVASVVNAIGKSHYWDSTAIVVVWDDWGGFYDHVPPPQIGSQAEVGGPGFRVPMIVVSAYAHQGVVLHHVYGFGSIVRFVEDTFGLPSLNTTDAISRDFAADAFEFRHKPRKFVPVAAKYSQNFFEHQAPSGLPVDTQ